MSAIRFVGPRIIFSIERVFVPYPSAKRKSDELISTLGFVEEANFQT